MSEPKKISFGFAKKQPLNPKIKLAPKPEPTVEFISSVEGEQFETIGGKVEEKKEELVIPLKDSTPLWQRKLIAKRREKKNPTLQNGVKVERDALDVLAEEEIIREASEAMAVKEEEAKLNTIPLNLEEEEVEDDRDEPTQENYAAIPVKDFGLAMLRGMGWAPGKGIGKNPKVVEMKEPSFRPRGMGLGVEMKKPPKKTTEETQDLKMCKGAYVKVFQGPLQGCYGKVESMHDSLGRVVVRMALGGKIQSICEYMLELVTVKEYNTKSKLVTTENAAVVQRSLDTQVDTNGTAEKSYGLVHLKGSPERSEKRKKSPESKRKDRSPERRRKSRSPDRRKRSPEGRKRSPEGRRRSPDRRKRSPERRKRSRSPYRRR